MNLELESELDQRAEKSFNTTTCFFCLKDLCTSLKSRSLLGESESQSSDCHDFPIRNFTRFLKLFHNDDDDESLNKKVFTFANHHNSSVPTCEDCSVMTKEFTELHHLLEVAKMRVNWCVRKIQDVIVMTKDHDNDDESRNLAQEHHGENLLAELRTKIKNRMTRIPLLPRVVLSKTHPSSMTASQSNLIHVDLIVKQEADMEETEVEVNWENNSSSSQTPDSLQPQVINSTENVDNEIQVKMEISDNDDDDNPVSPWNESSDLPPSPSSNYGIETSSISMANAATHPMCKTMAKIKPRHVCSHCSKVCVSNSKLEEHMRVHTNDRPFKCEKCPKSFAKRGNLKKHFQGIHGKQPLFQCRTCPKTFRYRQSLVKHQLHSGDN